ncbi:MAG: ECF transporter S component [Ruminiclostridium sp.]|nr:ECF transporter S component [Ruminiclostridium sp.]
MEEIKSTAGSTVEAVTGKTSAKAADQTEPPKIGLAVTLAGMGLMTAIVFVLQWLSGIITLGPFNITLALAPIIIGAAVYGTWAGAWLGFVFGGAVLLCGQAAAFFPLNPVGTIVTVLVKGTLAGLLAGLAYNAINKKNKYIAVVTAGIITPVVNTGMFLVGCFIFFMDTISEWAAGAGQPVMEYIIIGFIGLNFPIELMINLALSTVIVTIIGFVKKTIAEK